MRLQNVAYRSIVFKQVVKDARTGQPDTATPAATNKQGQVVTGVTVTGQSRQPEMTF